MDALAYIEKAAKTKPAPLFALTGDEDFLKRQARAKLVADLLEDADPDFALTSYVGEVAVWSAVKSELDTLPFLAPRRVVVIEQADTFVKTFRSQLEDYVAESTSRGVLILDVKTWPANTKLAKATTATTIIGKSLDITKAQERAKVRGWCQARAQSTYGNELPSDSAEWLIELVGGGMGQLDQELAKLVTFAGAGKTITRELVDKLVGHSRAAETFKIFDAIGHGQPATALAILHRLFDQDEEPIALLGAFSWQLRRLAAISRIVRTGVSLNEAFDRVGVPPYYRREPEVQLRHLGKERMDQVYNWLIETDLGMKGSSELPDKLILEQLVVKLARVEKPVAVGR
jgi:DNA polymerase III subunit delta